MMDEDEGGQLAWAADPERVDPDDYAPSQPFVKQFTWGACPTCGVQAHLPVTQFLYRGLVCPHDGTAIFPAPPDPEEWLQRVLRQEDELSEQL